MTVHSLSTAFRAGLSWQQQLAAAFSSITELCAYLELDPARLPVNHQAAEDFPLKVPLSFAARMKKGHYDDPLLRQVLPVRQELNDIPGFSPDPVGDLHAAVMPGLLHKYHGRVLMINTGSCAINCRYCFRRNFPYGEQQLSKQQEERALSHLLAKPEITEAILSGGDPLILSDARLAGLLQKLEAVPHLKRIRIHSRLPIVLPDRMTGDLIKLLSGLTKQVVLVVHSNHPNELDEHISEACFSLKKEKIFLLNQAVLLRGVNDNSQTLCDLSEKLFSSGIMPYYLHQLDKAKGTGHFEVPEAEAKRLLAALQKKLPGYLVPKLVKEVALGESKKLVV